MTDKSTSSEWPECAEVPLTNYETLGELMLALKMELPLPVILTSSDGRSRWLIRPESRDGVVQGMMLALEHRLEQWEES